MVLTIDIGNTNITIGAFKDNELVFVSRLATDKKRMADQYACEIMNIFKLYSVEKSDFSGSILSSVVPEVTFPVGEAVRRLTGITSLIVGPGIKTGLNILIDDPSILGADFVTGGVAAMKKYPLPCFVVDLGTASKIYVIDENGSFLGCTIAAGINVSMNALSASASLLPSIGIKSAKSVIGKNTVDSILSGTLVGTAAMIDGMIERFSEEIGRKPASIVATGGFARSVIANCKTEIEYDKYLLLEGLKIIYDKNVKSK
ncbi:MAG: type III pantothenate kinase [Ruminococcaceae bacterium]|nr:type III pantothenate kinase [Oscillospiraceae bacterium]